MHLASIVARHWPFANGSGRIIDKFGNKIDLGTGEREVETSHGFPLAVLADDLIGRHILLTGQFDHSIVKQLLSRARPGDVLLDIGANIGYVTACFLQKVQDGSAVCVEPQPGIVDLLRKNMRHFRERAEVHQVALSDHDGEASFHINSINRGASRLTDSGEIKVRMLDAAKLLGGMSKLDLIKMDVEGHELTILRAIEPHLNRLKPRAILFEDHTGSVDIRSILERCGYTIYGIDKRLLRTRLSKRGVFNDYIALAQGA